MYERKHQQPVSHRHFVRRLISHLVIAVTIVMGSLAGGMLGYHYFEQLPWMDAFLNSAMLLGGMGPVNAPQTGSGKLFAGLYALYAGLVFIVVAGLLSAPVIHRLLHRFHWEDQR
jgi:hypothetical protein